VRFPLAEGIGVFLGVAAWDLLTAGEAHFLKAALLGAGGAIVWYAARGVRVRLTHTSSHKTLTRETDKPEGDD